MAKGFYTKCRKSFTFRSSTSKQIPYFVSAVKRVKQRHLLYHFLFWILFFAGWHFFRYQDYPRQSAVWISLVKVTDLALLVYFTNYLLIPRLLYRKHYWIFGISFLALIIISSVTKMYILGRLLNNPRAFDLSSNLKGRIYDNVLPHILLVSTGAAFKLLLDQIRSQKRMAELAREKSDAELNFLKSQINPHFLFNSLNSIYFLIDKENIEARNTLLRFADLLRYQLYECNENTIGIEKEVEFLRDYIHLQELRRDKQYEINLSIPPDIKGFSLPPLLLIPFVENAFKHISHHHQESNYVTVEMNRLNGQFTFSVKNSKDDKERSTEPRGGIGLSNVKRRLDLLYPNRHRLDIRNTESTYEVILELKV